MCHLGWYVFCGIWCDMLHMSFGVACDVLHLVWYLVWHEEWHVICDIFWEAWCGI